ncbi:FkbM family methyltransferase [Fluviispira multicolorata]|uniref:FkbM family methyltransferase n=1 Tax=Fluviispira multicolorata TaxID=2654512 RepID=A0A833JER7_9BACT|nr:FkbM family methyltransferase [Fluviispira multicolorata]KAB8033349.1 FkbM family methyltransferase [Fluviispira multicolorata]
MKIRIKNRRMVNFHAKKRWIKRLNIFKFPGQSYVEWNGFKIYVDLSDWCGPSYHVLNWGMDTYESRSMEILEYISSEDSVFIDIGANIGIFSIMMANKFPKMSIYSFEPEPDAFNCLNNTIKKNNIKNVNLNKHAISNKISQEKFYYDSRNHGGHSLDPQSIIDEGSLISHSLNVNIETLDHFIGQNCIPKIDIIKIDVQRHEDKVLEGAINSIQKFRPILLIECYVNDMNSEESVLMNALKKFENYFLYEPKSKALSLLENYSKELFLEKINNKAVEYCDLFFIPSEKKDNFLNSIN